ncbi:MAG TPA: 3-phosphoshikimate 1-carboxyvinyltransferase [Candidatus Acidoferrales bacterium]|nr:3-phosphoshikimate 1-carboxyvinyltransferase [Candidatus Acidoferrales bacterium]
MNVKILSSKIKGRVDAPPSKSYTHRALIMASLSKSSRIFKPLISNDTCATFRACESIGASITKVKDEFIVDGVGGEPEIPEDVIDCANSGTTLRFMVAVCSLIDGMSILTGDSSLRKRPNAPLVDALNELGAHVESSKENGAAPIVVKGVLRGGRSNIISPISSQFISALLIACPLCQSDTTLNVHDIRSRPYVEITLELLKNARINVITDFREFMIPGAQEYSDMDIYVPGDFSSASFHLAAAAITNSRLTVNSLVRSRQGDERIVDILKEMGARVEWKDNEVTVDGAELIGVKIDAGDVPDLVPILAVLGTFAKGKTEICNVSNLRYKETDRLLAMTTELRKMGVDIGVTGESLIIKGTKPVGTRLHGYGDHRIVMALTVAGLASEGETQIDTAESVNVSYPDFFDDLFALGANIEPTPNE